MKKYLSAFHPSFARSLVYMLQSNEYNVGEYLSWFWRAPDLRRVARRGKLVPTAKAQLLLLAAAALVLTELMTVIWCLWQAFTGQNLGWAAAAVTVTLVSPFVSAYGLALVLWLGQLLVQRPRERAIIARAAARLPQLPGYRIAIAGSFGKTTFKETLATVLGAGKQVAATPGNMNTPLGISRFVARLTGQEEVLIFELGEYYPKDIEKLCQLVRPQLGIITGVNEAHLSKFKTLDRTINTIFELADALPSDAVYKNGDSSLVRTRTTADDLLLYTAAGVNGWTVSHTATGLDGTSFTAERGDVKIHARSGLLGRHQVGPLVACIDIADRLGLKPSQIEKGLSSTRPFEHRLEPRRVAGAWVIDDTYNGNTDGVRTALAWLAEVPAARRIYVTPGLVEQGDRMQAVHEDIGRQIAAVADIVVLMKNTVTPYIERGLKAADFQGEIKLVADPVHFYTNLEQFVATGDVVLMQNDWTDNFY